MHFVVGYTFHEQQRLSADSFGLLPAAESLDPETASAQPTQSGDFEEALRMIAEGLETLSASARAGASPGPGDRAAS